MNKYRKGKYIGMIGAVTVHVIFILFLLLYYFAIPRPEAESGLPIMMGVEEASIGGEKVGHYIEVDVIDEPLPPAYTPPMETTDVDQELITQTEEETVVIEKPKKKEEKKKILVKEPNPTPVVKKEVTKEVKVPEKTAEEIALEKERARAIQLEKERKEMEEAARRKVANAFGKGAQLTGEKTGTERVENGVTEVPKTPVSAAKQSGYGTFDLGGRSIGGGGLPLPIYNVSEEGKVVVSITVNPQGKVTNTSIHKDTNTMNFALRKAAEEAAKKAQFNAISGLDNQIGTITYYFNLK